MKKASTNQFQNTDSNVGQKTFIDFCRRLIWTETLASIEKLISSSLFELIEKKDQYDNFWFRAKKEEMDFEVDASLALKLQKKGKTYFEQALETGSLAHSLVQKGPIIESQFRLKNKRKFLFLCPLCDMDSITSILMITGPVIQSSVFQKKMLQISQHIFNQAGSHLQKLNCVEEKKQNVIQLESDIGKRTRELERITKIMNRNNQKLEKLRIDTEVANSQMIQSLNERNFFIANVSHEIRSPLTGIIGLSEILLEDQKLNKIQREIISDISDCGNFLHVLINDILDYSKIGSGKIDLDVTEFDLLKVIQLAQNLMRPKLEKKSVVLNFSKDMNTPRLLYGDELRLQQIIINLISNAVKFTEKGSVDVSIKTIRDSTHDCELLFTVSDTGPGIHPRSRKKIFEPFYQSRTSTYRTIPGTGLGLAISKKLSQLMGGELWFTSRWGYGSKFSLQLGFKKVMVENHTVSSQVGSVSPPDLTGKKVLVVDDNQINMVVMQKYLRKLNAFTEMATDGKEAVKQATEVKPDLIMMDCRLPELTGWDATKRIRSNSDKRISHIPIIAFTASVTPEEVELCKLSGMDGILKKPILKTDLYKILTLTLFQNKKSKDILSNQLEFWG